MIQIHIVKTVIAGISGIALKKNSPYTPFFNQILMKIILSGQMDKMKAYYESNNVCDPAKKVDGTSLSYQKVITLFLIIGSGMSFAVIVLVYELISSYCRPRIETDIMEVIEPRFKDTSVQTFQKQCCCGSNGKPIIIGKSKILGCKDPRYKHENPSITMK